MNIRDKIDRIDQEIKEGIKGKAIGRLNNLIYTYPDEVRIRIKVAEVYYNAGFLDLAGKYWILSELTDTHVRRCIELYEKSLDNSGRLILEDIKFRGDKNLLSLTAQTKLNELETDSFNKWKYIPKFKLNRAIRKEKTIVKPIDKVRRKILNALILILIISIPIFAIIGIISVFR